MKLCCSLVVAASVAGLLPAAGAPGDLDLSFDLGSMINGDVNTMAVLDNGKLVIGGTFTTVSGATRNGLAVLNADGTTDTTFLAGEQGAEGWTCVNVVAVQLDGRILVGGGFTRFNGMDRGSLARLNVDGSLDLTFSPSFGGRDYPAISALALQNDGKIVVGGYFATLNGQGQTNIVRLNEDGTPDPTFLAAADGFWGVSALALQSDGKILLGGSFTNLSGVAGTNLARLNPDGSLDDSFVGNVGGPEEVIRCLALLPDGGILVGGSISEAEGADRNGLARLRPDGSLVESFDPIFSAPCNGIQAIAVQPDGKAIVAGEFYTTADEPVRYLARFHPDGRLDNTFLNGFEGPDSPVWSLALLPDGRILIGSNFNYVNGTPRRSIAALNGNGSLDLSFSNGVGGPDGYPQVLAAQADGQVLVGGSFQNINGTNKLGLARLNANGSLDNSFCPVPFTAGDIHALALQDDGKILVGGGATLVRLNADGSLDSSFNAPPNEGEPYPYIRSLVIQPDERILVGGTFASIGAGTNRFLARLNPDGSVDPSFLSGMIGPDNSVAYLGLQSDGKIIVRGWFLFYNGTLCNGFVRINSDGSLDDTFQYPRGRAAPLNFAIQPDDKILIGVNVGDELYGIERLNADGSMDGTSSNDAVKINNPCTLAFALQTDGKFLIGGCFDHLNGAPCGRVARLNTDGSLDTAFSDGKAGADFDVWAMVKHGGGVVIGGAFSRVNQVPRRFLARLLTASDPAPFLVTSPVSQAKDIGTTAHFQALAEGAGIIQYRWFFNGTNQLSGASQPDLYLSDVQLAQAGMYSIAASNNYGAVTSAPARLAVLVTPPNVRQGPSSRMTTVGDFAYFPVIATGSLPLSYQWCRNGVALDGKTGAVLRLLRVQTLDAGVYSVTVSNSVGSVAAGPVTLDVLAPQYPVTTLRLVSAIGLPLNLDRSYLPQAPGSWSACDTVDITAAPQFWFDPALPGDRCFYRAWHYDPLAPPPVISVHTLPALMVSGDPGNAIRVDCRDRFGPITSWAPLVTLTLTNAVQRYVDTSALGQPPRLYRLVPLP